MDLSKVKEPIFKGPVIEGPEGFWGVLWFEFLYI